MTDGWKRFWIGLGTGVLGILMGILGLEAGLRRKGNADAGKTESITKVADAEVTCIKTEIKADTDAALLERFNRLAKKKDDSK